MTDRALPKTVVRILEWMVPDPIARAGLIGDLEERYRLTAPEGRIGAAVWLIGEVGAIGYHYGLVRGAGMDTLRRDLAFATTGEVVDTANVTELRAWFLGDTGRQSLMLMAAVSLMLLVTCANVANLLFIASERRAGEMALRTALGASRGRIYRQLLTESLVLAVLGGTAGLALAVIGLDALLVLVADVLPPGFAERIGMDAPVGPRAGTAKRPLRGGADGSGGAHVGGAHSGHRRDGFGVAARTTCGARRSPKGAARGVRPVLQSPPSRRSGRRSRVRRAAFSRRHASIRAWSPERSTSGTSYPRYSGGRV